MYALLLAALLTTPSPSATAEPNGNGSSAANPAPVESSPAPSIGREPPAPDFARSSEGVGFSASLVWPVVALVALAAASLFLARRRSACTRLLEVMETTGLGSKRSLVVARIGSELLILGVSDSGITLLTTRPAQAQMQPVLEGIHASLAAAEREPLRQPKAANPIASLLSRLHTKAQPPPEPSFDACLLESTEDQELRRKLARGLSGSVR